MFNEVCDLGDLLEALDWYSRKWRRRRNMYRWVETNADLRKVYEDYGQGDATEAELITTKKNAWDLYAAYKGLPVDQEMTIPAPRNSPSPQAIDIRFDDDEPKEVAQPAVATEDNDQNGAFEEYDEMSDIEEWHDDAIDDELPDVIPEKFLWTVFDQLVNAFTILGTGGDGEPEGEQWKEIVHKDVHLGNIFVKKRDDAEGVRIEEQSGKAHWFVRYEPEEVRIHLC